MRRNKPQYARPSRGPKSTGNEGREFLLYGLAVALLIVGGLAYVLWVRGQASSLPEVALQVGIGCDISKSLTPDEKRQYCGLMNNIVDQAFPNNTSAYVWSYSEVISKLYEGKPRNARALRTAQSIIIENSSGDWGTRQALVMQEMVRVGQEAERSGTPVAFVLFTDGEDHWKDETKAKATELAKLPNLKCVLVGPVEKEMRMATERNFAPLHEQGKLIVFSKTDTRDGIERFRDIIHR